MLLTIEKILFFKSTSLFKDISAEQLQYLSEISEEKGLSANTIIFNDGDPGDSLYVIVKGAVRIYKMINEKKHVFAILNSQECFGEMAILDNETRSASAETIEESTFLVIDRENFYQLIRKHIDIAFEIFKVLSARIREMNKKI